MTHNPSLQQKENKDCAYFFFSILAEYLQIFAKNLTQEKNQTITYGYPS